MAISFLTPSRTILLITDDGLGIFSVGSRGVKLVEVVPWQVDDFVSHVTDIIAKDLGGKPILIISDMVEQHYRKEKIPRVSVMDKQNVVKRKLKVAFPNYPVQAALPLKEKIAKSSKTMAGSLYLFAAVPASEAFNKTMEAARHSLAPIAGFCLLPVESSDMIQKLAANVYGKSYEKSSWTVFIGQHHSGGLRQIVVRNGNLALTRMTPISDPTQNTDAWAQDVHQEFQATISYLSRFGFSPEDGLNVMLAADEGLGDKVSSLIDVQCDFRSINVDSMARALRMKIPAEGYGDYADFLHAAWIGKKTKFILPMRAKQIDNVSKPRQITLLLTVLSLLGGAFQAYQLLDSYQELSERKDSIETLSNQKNQLDLKYQREIERKEELGFDIRLIQSALSVYDGFENDRIDILELSYKIGKALGRSMRVDSIRVERGKEPVISRRVFGQNTDKVHKYKVKFQMTFPSTTNAQKGNSEVSALRTRLQQVLPDNIVRVTKFLEDYEYSEAIVVETGEADKPETKQDYVAEIEIEGPEKDD